MGSRAVRVTPPEEVGVRRERVATRVALTVSSTIPATLTVAGRRFHADRRPTRLSLGVRPGRRRLVLTLRLSAGGKHSTETLRIARL